MDTLGNVGGIFEIVFFTAAILYCCYKDRARNYYLQKIVHHKDPHEYTSVFGDEKKQEVSIAMEEMIAEQQDAGRLTKKLVSFGAIESSILRPCHKVLSPLVSLAENLQREELKKNIKENPTLLLAQGVKLSEENMSFE